MPHSPIVQLLTLAALLASGFALWKGGTPERWAGAVNALSMVAGFVIQSLLPHTQDPFRFANDLAPGAIFLWLAVRYGSPWLGAVMLLYAAQFAMHAWFSVMQLPTHSHLHAVLNNIDFTGVVVCLTAGTALAWRRKAVAEQRLADPASGLVQHT